MKSFKITISALLLFAFCLFQSNANAQDAEDTPYWYVSYYQIQGSRVDSLSKLVAKYTARAVAMLKKNGRILDYNFLIHDTGSADNVVIMIKYPSWDAIDEGAGFGQAQREIEPDEAIRDAINAAFNWCFEGSTHTDTIYRDAMDSGGND